MNRLRSPVGSVLSLGLALIAAGAEDPGSESRPNLGDLSIEQLMDLRIEKVAGASKYEQRVTQAPASVTVVTADEIAKLGYRTLADILQSVRDSTSLPSAIMPTSASAALTGRATSTRASFCSSTAIG